MSEGTLHVVDSRTSKSYEIPVHRNVIRATDFQAIKGPEDGSDLADQIAKGLRLYDPGYRNTAVSESKITYIDSQLGIVQYRGYNIAEPTPEQREAFRQSLYKGMKDVPESVIQIIQSFPKAAGPMHMVIAGLAAYAGEDPDHIPAKVGGDIYMGKLEVVDDVIPRTLAYFSVCAALAFCHRASIDFTPPKATGTFLSNILLMMGKVETSIGKPDADLLRHVRRLWALGADIGHSNSTAAFLHAASAVGDPFSCLISSLASGYGILHFGAAEASFKSLAAVGGIKNVPWMIEQVKKGNIKLFGYGHRMFNTVDPRIPFAAQILRETGVKHPLFEVAMEIDRIASKDEYFTSRNLQANSDLYIGVLYEALGFEAAFVPVMIALMRAGGMMAHWREAMSQPKPIIWRPAQFYTGNVSPVPPNTSDSGTSNWVNARAAGNLESLQTMGDLLGTTADTESNLTNGTAASGLRGEATSRLGSEDSVAQGVRMLTTSEKDDSGEVENPKDGDGS